MEVDREEGFGIGGLADGGEGAATVLGTGPVEGMVVVATLPLGDPALDIPAGLVVPTIHFPPGAIGDDLERVVLGLENGNAADKAAIDFNPVAARCPGVSGELGAHFPLTGPGSPEGGGGLVVFDVVSAGERTDHIRPAGVEDRVAGQGVADVEGLGEGKLNRAIAGREENRIGAVFAERVSGEVELQRPGRADEGLGGLGRALEIAVGCDKGSGAVGERLVGVSCLAGFLVPLDMTLAFNGVGNLRALIAPLEKRRAGDFKPLGKGPAGDEMDGFFGRFPVLHVLAESLVRAGAVGGKDGGVDGMGEGGIGHNASRG